MYYIKTTFSNKTFLKDIILEYFISVIIVLSVLH